VHLPPVAVLSYEAALRVDRYLRVRSRPTQAHRPRLWLGVNNRGPMTANGIYQKVARRGKQCGVDVWPHRSWHHFSHTWLDRGGAEGDLMELNGWSSPQVFSGTAAARAARGRAVIMTSS
jgi:integrase